jgi:hypothetical protein
MIQDRLIIDMQSDHERDVLFKAATLALDPFGIVTQLAFREPIDMDADPDYEYPEPFPWLGVSLITGVPMVCAAIGFIVGKVL